MSLQFLPFASHRLHWYVKLIGAVPVHVPLAAVSVCPTWAVPTIVGDDWFVGLTVIAAVPVRKEPKIAPIASAASARAVAVSVRRPMIRESFIASPPLPGCRPDLHRC